MVEVWVRRGIQWSMLGVAGLLLLCGPARPAWAFLLPGDTGDTEDSGGLIETGSLDPGGEEEGGEGTAEGGTGGGRLSAETLHGLSSAEYAGDEGGADCATVGAVGGVWLLGLAGCVGLLRRRARPRAEP